MQTNPLFRAPNPRFRNAPLSLVEVGEHINKTKHLSLTESRKHFDAFGLNYDKVMLYYKEVCSMEFRYHTSCINENITKSAKTLKKPLKPKPEIET